MVPTPLLLALFSIAFLVAAVAGLIRWLGPRLANPRFATVAGSGVLIALALVLTIVGAQAVWLFVVLLAIGGLLII
jgi:hypothetical protein